MPVQAKAPPEAGPRAPLPNETLSIVAPEVVGSTVAYKKFGVLTVSTREVDTMLNSPAVYAEPTTASVAVQGTEACRNWLS